MNTPKRVVAAAALAAAALIPAGPAHAAGPEDWHFDSAVDAISAARSELNSGGGARDLTSKASNLMAINESALAARTPTPTDFAAETAALVMQQKKPR
ncbi:hypothetical protein [Streptomyces sp. NPDC048248]|uniref:hypothetical protein n=1 Tax=Streptomyces sp. NPDC048248 TaxID=3365523 RepID=UPI00371951B2